MSRVPSEFICPISQSMMNDPVTLTCGHTFDRDNVTTWIVSNSTCPTCRHRVNENNLYTNWSLKSLINKFNNVPDEDQEEEEEIIGNNSVEEIELNETVLKSITASISCKKDLIDLCLDIPDSPRRRPVSFVCVIDVSGSMGCTVGNAEGDKAFTRLDLVKHVLNVMIASLTESDRLALLSFSDDVYINFDLAPMNSVNKKIAKQCVSRLSPLASTYTGPALRKAYEFIKKCPKNHLKSIILLTDGQDTDGSDILEKTFDVIKKPDQVQLNTFGFSNDIVSDCLQRLASKGKGIFGFIPDQSMIGTIFINFLANTFLTLAQNLEISLSNGFTFVDTVKQTKSTIIQSGKKHHFLIRKTQDLNKFALNLGFSNENLKQVRVFEEEYDDENFKIQKCRNNMMEILTHPQLPCLDLIPYETKFKVPEFLFEIIQTDIPDPNNEQIRLSLKFWNSWGAHYVRSFKFAHLYEQAINFKSPSMKFYRTEKFDELIDKLTEIFITLPPPKPSGTSYGGGAQIHIANIMDRNNGCILSSCLVELKSGEFKQIGDLKKDDILSNGSKVTCLVKSIYSGKLVKISDLVITPYHPIFYETKWQFPIDIYINSRDQLSGSFISLIESNKSIEVCNLVLDKKHYGKIEGFNCITLGHGYNQDPVLRHPYYGSKKCVEDLMSLKGWNEGLVRLNDFRVRRDQDGLVCAMDELKEVF